MSGSEDPLNVNLWCFMTINFTDEMRMAGAKMQHMKLDVGTKTLVVGDIHGCFDEFLSLLDLAGVGDSDNVVSVGDLVDRGPQSWKVVDFFMQKPETRHAVMGNHEWKHLMHAGKAEMPSRAGMLTRKQMGQNYAQALNYFDGLPFTLELPDVLVVHAGVDPRASLANTDPKLLMGVGSSGRSGFDGDSPWWFDAPQLALSKPVVFGHHVFPHVARGERNNVWGINTGASYGGRLTGLLLPEFRLVSVPTADYVANTPRFGEAEEDLLQIAGLRWDRLQQMLNNDRVSLSARASIEKELDKLQTFVCQMAEKAHILRQEYGVDLMSGDEKRLLFTRLRQDNKFQGRVGKVLLDVVNGHEAWDVVVRQFPRPELLEPVSLFQC